MGAGEKEEWKWILLYFYFIAEGCMREWKKRKYSLLQHNLDCLALSSQTKGSCGKGRRGIVDITQE